MLSIVFSLCVNSSTSKGKAEMYLGYCYGYKRFIQSRNVSLLPLILAIILNERRSEIIDDIPFERGVVTSYNIFLYSIPCLRIVSRAIFCDFRNASSLVEDALLR